MSNAKFGISARVTNDNILAETGLVWIQSCYGAPKRVKARGPNIAGFIIERYICCKKLQHIIVQKIPNALEKRLDCNLILTSKLI